MSLAHSYAEKEVYTEDEYFAFEREAFGRWEYIRGEIRAMAGGTDDHNTIVLNVGSALRSAVAARGCRAYVADMKVHTGDGVNTFPDAMVVCGPRRYYRNRTDIITNPILIVEVLSDSTEAYDRSERFDHYKTVPALTDYLLVHPNAARVTLYTRREDHWELRDVSGLQNSVTLTPLAVTLSLADIYALIEFADNSAAS